ncbi:hypothetical protein WICPIJ_008057 [Wickerhamomyces pijperi]|uniref:Uncharacterized protein n=1 Tax=Wickerhamomyces pijperi TaxID=599730 RepID=A0A9P8PYM8_WICPI|nr:hypothetical protein WICPIJ_008057 [Wickerhamomyces pijperi]
MSASTPPASHTVPESEATLPENTPSQPQPTLIKVANETLAEQKEFALKKYLSISDPNLKHKSRQQQLLEIRSPTIRKFTAQETEDPNHTLQYSETDEKGEAKITPNGHLVNGKKWLINTFTLPGRGKELFAASTEVAKFLQIRDAFVMFTRHKQLHKLLTSEEERKFIDSSSLGLSKLKTRQISLVNVKNLYMVFGCRLVAKGVRVEDDYWEDDLISQGFSDKNQVFPAFVGAFKAKSSSSAASSSTATPSQQAKALILNSTSVGPASLKTLYTKTTPITPQPTMEERMEYLANSRVGETTHILPGQGITGGFELANIATHPQYRGDSTSGSHSKQSNKTLVSSLLLSNSGSGLSLGSSSSSTKHTSNHIPINESLKGMKSNNGLPYYDQTIAKRIAREDASSLREIEYLHDLVQTNTLVKQSRAMRTKQWKLYWQGKAGVDVGLTKDKVEDFFKKRQDFMQFFEEDVKFNEYTNKDQVSTKRRKPNGNYLGACTIRGLKAPYLEKPEKVEAEKVESTKKENEDTARTNDDENEQVPVSKSNPQSINSVGVSVN